MIIAIGFRVNSSKATEFRNWAINILKKYTIKGYAMDVIHFYKYFESLRSINTFSIFLQRNNLTLKKLSEKTNISISTLKSLKEGQRDIKNLKSSYLEKISHYLGIEMQTLLGEITLDIKK